MLSVAATGPNEPDFLRSIYEFRAVKMTVSPYEAGFCPGFMAWNAELELDRNVSRIRKYQPNALHGHIPNDAALWLMRWVSSDPPFKVGAVSFT